MILHDFDYDGIEPGADPLVQLLNITPPPVAVLDIAISREFAQEPSFLDSTDTLPWECVSRIVEVTTIGVLCMYRKGAKPPSEISIGGEIFFYHHHDPDAKVAEFVMYRNTRLRTIPYFDIAGYKEYGS